MTNPPAERRRPAGLTAAVVLVALEGAALVAVGLLYAVRGLLGDAESAAGAELGAVLITAVGALLLLAARGLSRRRRWARAPVVVVQLLAVPVGTGLLSGRVWVPAAVVLGLAAGTVAALAVPSSRAAFDG